MTTFREQVEADWAGILNSDEFDTEGAWVDSSGSSHTVRGIFLSPYIQSQVNAPVAAEDTSFQCLASSVSGIKSGDKITINSVDYEVMGPPQLDGEGMIKLLLSEYES